MRKMYVFVCFTLFVIGLMTLSGTAETAGGCSCRTRAAQPRRTCACASTLCSNQVAVSSGSNDETYFSFSDTITEQSDTETLASAAKEQPADEEQVGQADPWVALFGTRHLRRDFSQEGKNLQIYLNVYMRLGAKKTGASVTYLVENGIFDSLTEQALRAFQIDYEIGEIDYASEETKARLYEVIGFIF